MKAKKIISFCSMFSLVLILSVYYVLSPITIDMGVSNMGTNEDVNVEIIDGESAYFNNLDVLKETAYLEQLKELDAIVASKETSSEEKIAALESKNKKIIGVYFQSQDGDNFFKYTSVNLTRQQKLLQNKRAKESASMVPLAELIKINEEDIGKEIVKEKDILKDTKLEETTHEKATDKVDNDKEHATEQKAESVVKNTNSVVVPDKNDGVTTKSKVYVEYIDISKENK
jgi:hypothetical protein